MVAAPTPRKPNEFKTLKQRAEKILAQQSESESSDAKKTLIEEYKQSNARSSKQLNRRWDSRQLPEDSNSRFYASKESRYTPDMHHKPPHLRY